MHKRVGVYKLISVLLISASLLGGCGEASFAEIPVSIEREKSVETVPEKLSMLQEAELLYEVPVMVPDILVDQKGYDVSESKLAIIETTILPASFAVVDSDSGEEVFKGRVKKVKCTEDGEVITGICDFSALNTTGSYYIRADIIGASYEFCISDNLYETQMKDAYDKFENFKCKCYDTSVSLENNRDIILDVSGGYHTDYSGKKDVYEGCLSVLDLLSSYEFNRKGFSDSCSLAMSDNKIPDVIDIAEYEIEWLIKMQNSETGAVYSSVIRNDSGDSVVIGETTNATALFCAAMAKGAMVLKSSYPDTAKKCSNAANKAWKCIEANKTLVPDELMFRAAVEMYKLTGYGVYNTVISDYLKANADKGYSNRIVLDGAISYLSTPRSTDTKVCSNLMNNFMSRTEDKATSAANSRYYVESGEHTADELLRNAYELTIVDYAISSTEYTRLEKNYLHYLGGRNKENSIYLDELAGLNSYAELIALTSMIHYKK